jgi:hypothetical protein
MSALFFLVLISILSIISPYEDMQISIAETILKYPTQVLELRQKFLKRSTLDEFKKISDGQIEK